MIRLLTVLSLLTGCAAAPEVRPAPKPTTVDEGAVKTAILKIWADELVALERGDGGPRGLPGLAVIGVGGPATSGDWLHQIGIQPKKMTVHSTSPLVGVTHDGRAAWVSDVVDITPPGKPAVGIRVTQLFAEAEGQWWVAAAHWSVGVPSATIERDQERYQIAPRTTSVSSGAEPVVSLYERGLASSSDFLDALSARPDAVFFGLAPEEHIDGGPSVKEVLAEQLKTLGVRFRKLGAVRADVIPSGRVGWVVGQIEVTLPSKTRVPARALFIYENEGGVWREVQGHLSLPVDHVMP